MKVLVVASTFPAHADDSVPAFVRDQIIHMKKDDPSLEFHVLAPHFRNQTKSYNKNGFFTEYRFRYFWPAEYQRLAGHGIIPALKSNKWLHAQIPFLFLGELFALLRLTWRIKPDVIYAHWFTPQGVTSAIVSFITRRPWVLTSHASDVQVWNNVPFGGLVVRYILPKAHAITAVSNPTLTRMRKFFTENKWQNFNQKVKIIPMGVDTSVFSHSQKSKEALKQSCGLGGKTVFLFVGRLTRRKGVEYLLKAFERLPKRDHEYHLVVAGDGPSKRELETLTRDLSLQENVNFVGYVSGETKEDYFHLADVVVVPSITDEKGFGEGLPVVIMEALASGKICVASDVSNAEIIIKNRENGYIVPEKDAESLKNAMEKAIKLTPVQRRKMQEAAANSSCELDWSVIARRHIQHLFK